MERRACTLVLYKQESNEILVGQRHSKQKKRGKKEGAEQKRKSDGQKQGGGLTRNNRLEETHKRETGRQIENQRQRGAVSSILAQVGSGPDIFSSPRGVCRCHSLQHALFPLIPPKKHFQTFHKDQQEGQLDSRTPLTPTLFSFSSTAICIVFYFSLTHRQSKQKF